LSVQFKALEPGIEASGASIGAFVEAFKLFPSVIVRKLTRHGVGKAVGKQDIEVDPNAWYPQESWLAAWEEIAAEIGPRACHQIGRHLPKHAPFPPTVTDIYAGIASVDVAYHLNHRKRGKPMFDMSTGAKASGIGNYGFQPVSGERKIVSVCDNPYPCDFDRGILSEIASKFERASRVTHNDQAPCRKNGADTCTYTITW
jgi:hypothetical protein